MKKIFYIFIVCVIIISGGLFLYIDKNNEIALKENEYVLNVGEDKKILFSTEKKYKYISSDTSVVSVNDEGILVAKSEGKATIKIKKGWKTKTCEVTVLPIITDIDFEFEQYSIKKGEEISITYKKSPPNAEVESEKWSSSDENIVSVENGKIKALSVGNSKITLVVNDKIEKSVLVNVYQEVEEIVFDKTEVDLEVGSSYTIKVDVKPSDATNKNLVWKSNDDNIAKVTNGKVEALKAGTTIISAESNNNKVAQIKVNVSDIKVQSVSLNKNKITTYVGYNFKLDATIQPSNAKDKTITWSSSNKDVADVKNGNVVVKKTGTAIITAKTSNGKYSTCKVVVVNNTYGKTAIFFGDSITQGILGTPENYSWANYIGDHYDLKSSTNAGRSGWFISNHWNWWIKSVIEEYKNKKFDYVIMNGGVNDIHQSASNDKFTLGTFNKKNFSGNYDTSTILGGLETCLYTIKKQWPKAKVGFIITYYTPLSKYGKTKDFYSKYYSAMKDVLNKWNIKYIDLFDGANPSGIKYSDLLKVNTKKYLPDGLHLNGEGYKLISPYIYNWMNTL